LKNRLKKSDKKSSFVPPTEKAWQGLKYYYPMVKYLDGPIIKDTKNIPYQNFVEKYCKQMQVFLLAIRIKK